jgi:hypothetical protein
MIAATQVALINEEITLYQKELISLQQGIEAQKRKINATAASLKTLNLKYDHAKRLHEAHRRDLSAHERDLADLEELKRRLDEDASTEEEEAVDFLPAIPNQTAQRKAEISFISKNLKEMQEDAQAKYCVQRLSEQHLAAMEHYHNGILNTLSGLKGAFSPIRKVPAECWATIFRYRVEEDFEEYVKKPGNMSIQSTTIVLSHVCYFWRRVVHAERDLWKYFICGPDHAKMAPQIERWKHYTSFEPRSFVFVTNLYARSRSPVSNDGIEMARVAMSSTTHSLHVISGISQVASISTNSLPFNGQLSVTVQVDEPVTPDFIDSLSTCFPAVTNMTFRFKSRLLELNPSIHSKRPFLERLVMDLKDFEPFWVDCYFHERNLRELHVIHNGESALPERARRFLLLEVLGITPPDTEWLRIDRFPVLKHLVLHGPKNRAIISPSLVRLSQHASFHRIKNLEMQNWPLYKPTGTPPWSIMPLVLAIAEKLRHVEIIRCVNSFIEGECLVSLVKLLKDTNASQSPSRLNKVILDHCSGITRRDCEAIASSVEKLVVYV